MNHPTEDELLLLAFGELPWEYAYHRTIETGLGIAMAMLVSLVPKLLPGDESRRQAS